MIKVPYRMLLERFDTREKNILAHRLVNLQRRKGIALDMEGFRLGTKGNILVLQIGLANGLNLIFDIQECPQFMVELKPVLESSSILKIVHAQYNDVVNLKNEFDIDLTKGPIFDTQLVSKLLFNDIQQINLNTLCNKIGVPENPVKFKSMKMEHNGFDKWKIRPITDEALDYAAHDVSALWPIFFKFEKLLIDEKRTQFLNSFFPQSQSNDNSNKNNSLSLKEKDHFLKEVCQVCEKSRYSYIQNNPQVLEDFIEHFDESEIPFIADIKKSEFYAISGLYGEIGDGNLTDDYETRLEKHKQNMKKDVMIHVALGAVSVVLTIILYKYYQTNP